MVKQFKTPLSIKKWLAFLSASVLGLAVNVLVMTSILAHWTLPYKFIAQAAGIASGMVFNFMVSKFFVWKMPGNVKP